MISKSQNSSISRLEKCKIRKKIMKRFFSEIKSAKINFEISYRGIEGMGVLRKIISMEKDGVIGFNFPKF